jgi:hypothetical protein
MDDTTKRVRVRKRRSKPRKKTIPVKRITRDQIRTYNFELRAIGADDIDTRDRPRTRGECPKVRPCPWVGCDGNLYLDVNPETGAITFNRPELEPWQMPAHQSCSYDIAELGGQTLEETADAINLTRERIRQIEVRMFFKLRERILALGVDGKITPGVATSHPIRDTEFNY